MTDLPIATTSGLRWVIDGWTPAQAQAALRQIEREAFGAGAVPLFADYIADTEPRWSTPAPSAHGFYELEPASRENLKARLGRRIGQLRRALDRRARQGSGDVARLSALVRHALEAPSWGALYAAAGEPVLAGWGHSAAEHRQPLGLFLPLDDGIALPAVLRSPWLAWAAGAAFAVLLLLGALAAAAWAPLAWLPWTVEAPRCRLITADLGLLDRYDRERIALEEIERQLADLRLNRERQKFSCPIETVELPAPPEEPKPPPDAQPCNADTKSGGKGVTRTTHFLGDKPGTVEISYEMYDKPDRMDVYYQGKLIASTQRAVKGKKTLTFMWRPVPGEYTVEIVLSGAIEGTSWDYRLNCPR